jgi:sugar/nucleoside kinase (ribokinase family)
MHNASLCEVVESVSSHMMDNPQPTQLCIIGDIAMDVHVGIPGVFPSDVNVNGNTLGVVELIPGGAAANTALWAHTSGISARLIAAIGEDLLGRALSDHLQIFGVHGSLELVSGVPSGSVVVITDSSGARTMFPSAGSNAFLSSSWASAALYGHHLHVNGYGLARSSTSQTYLDVIREARRRGMSVSYDVASFEIVRDHWATVETAARLSDVMFLNDDEWQASPPAALEELIRGRLVVHMMGELGCEARQGAERWRVGASQVEVMDTVGAGDAFTGGFLAAFLLRGDVAEALEQASLTAGVCVGRVGACPPLPTLEG